MKEERPHKKKDGQHDWGDRGLSHDTGLNTDGSPHKTHEKLKGFVSEAMGKFFEQESQNLAFRLFQDLLGKRKNMLVEVACSPDMRSRETVRCSIWNGCDLGEWGETSFGYH